MASEIIVNERRQKGNPLLKEIRHVKLVYDRNIIPDYIVGAKACVIFISIGYHVLKPEFLGRRLAELKTVSGDYRLRILLCLVDADDHGPAMHSINLAAIRSEATLILAHSSREAARFLECFKAYEHNNGAAIKEKIDKDHLSKLTDVMTTIKPLNKTDVLTLARTFGSFRNIVNATQTQLQDCPGIGDKKLINLRDVFDQPFSTAARLRRDQKNREKPPGHQEQQNDSVAEADLHQDDVISPPVKKKRALPTPPRPLLPPHHHSQLNDIVTETGETSASRSLPPRPKPTMIPRPPSALGN